MKIYLLKIYWLLKILWVPLWDSWVVSQLGLWSFKPPYKYNNLKAARITANRVFNTPRKSLWPGQKLLSMIIEHANIVSIFEIALVWNILRNFTPTPSPSTTPRMSLTVPEWDVNYRKMPCIYVQVPWLNVCQKCVSFLELFMACCVLLLDVGWCYELMNDQMRVRGPCQGPDYGN